MAEQENTSRDERTDQETERTLDQALRRYREQRQGYKRLRSGKQTAGVYRTQRGVRRAYRV
jgi:hypothetical protein